MSFNALRGYIVVVVGFSTTGGRQLAHPRARSRRLRLRVRLQLAVLPS